MSRVLLAVAALAFAGGAKAEDNRLDGPAWPDVVPEFCSWTNGPAPARPSLSPGRIAPDFTQPIEAHVETIGGAPEVVLNGKPFPMVWGAGCAHKRPDKSGHMGTMEFNAVKVPTFYTEWNPRDGVYDFSKFDAAAANYAKYNPEAYFIFCITAYPPTDWLARHPEARPLDDHGEVNRVGRVNWSWSSRPAMAKVREIVGAVVGYLESTPYANRILGYRICSGDTIEWLNWHPSDGRVLDFCPVTKQAYADYAREFFRSVADPHVPSRAERCALDGTDIVWDATRHLNAIAYHEYTSRVIADDALELCAHVKALTGGRKLVGTYYGYSFFLNSWGCDAGRGHYALKHFLENAHGKVDFVMSPQSYLQRDLGETCSDMKPFATFAAHGILPIIEDDTRTFCRRPGTFDPYTQSVTERHSRSILRRNMSIALCHRCTPYWYALANGADLEAPSFADDARLLRIVREHCLARKVARHAEVALVASEKSQIAFPQTYRRVETGRLLQSYGPDGKVKRTAEKQCPLMGEVFTAAHTKWARAGVPVDYVLQEDLADNPGDYKLYVFLNALVTDARTRKAVEAIRARGASVLWLYAPGWSNRASVQDMENLTGFAFEKVATPIAAEVTLKSDGRRMGTPKELFTPMFAVRNADEVLGTYANGAAGLAVRKVGKSTSWFSGVWQLDAAFIADLVRRCGVHVYTGSSDPVEANDALFTLHARFAGAKEVRLPRKSDVLDVFNRRIVARQADRFAFDAALHASYLFYLGDDADRLLERLNRERQSPGDVR